MAVSHGRSRYARGCRCSVCTQAQRDYLRAYRGRKRRLRPVPLLPDDVAPSGQNYVPGPCVAAVHAELATLGDLRGWQVLAAGAVAMARILDSGENVPTWPAAVKQLASLMETLHREAAPKRGSAGCGAEDVGGVTARRRVTPATYVCARQFPTVGGASAWTQSRVAFSKSTVLMSKL
jgi:hypothetical protein